MRRSFYNEIKEHIEPMEYESHFCSYLVGAIIFMLLLEACALQTLVHCLTVGGRLNNDLHIVKLLSLSNGLSLMLITSNIFLSFEFIFSHLLPCLVYSLITMKAAKGNDISKGKQNEVVQRLWH